MLKHLRTFKGGFRFKNYSGQAKPLLSLAELPLRVFISLSRSSKAEVKSLVKKGDIVFAGQIIGKDAADILSPAHASVNGIVEDIKYPKESKSEAAIIVIRSNDASRQVKSLGGQLASWQKLNNEKIKELIFLSGALGLPADSSGKITQIIVQETASEPYNYSLDLILEGKNTLNFIAGINVLKKIMPSAQVNLVISRKNNKIINEISKLTAHLDWFNLCTVEPKYPQGCQQVLLSTLLQKKIPHGGCASDLGVILLSAEEVLAVHDAVTLGKPFIEKIVALSGPSFKENIHLKVRLGTPLHEILEGRLKSDESIRLILNSLFTGQELKALLSPIDRTFAQIIAIADSKEREFLAFARPGCRQDSYSGAFLAHWLPGIKKSVDTNQHGEERPCISCGFCEYSCPAMIIPHLLVKYVRKEIIDEILISYEIFNCIECGLCSFVCPSKIPLLKYIQEGQKKLLAEGFHVKK